ncbi:MAG: DoxX family protein [Pseudomonadota bacterium]|nr:DoxX family protein [Pseudomonadota bacterium]
MTSLIRKLTLDWLGDRYEDAALFALRAATGLFLLYQSHDNVLSAARMDEFQGFMAQFGFWRPDILAPFAIFWQVAAGIGFILGLFVRPLGLITAIQFIVALWMVHWSQDYALWWPAAVLVFLGFYFFARGGGRYALDARFIARRG